MNKRVLVVGGYGNFGTIIANRLSREPGLALIVSGRSEQKAQTLAKELNAEWAQIDIFTDFDKHIERISPDILIHTSGPFQQQGYAVAEACIRNGVHYLDLADGREFVANITHLDSSAKAAGVLVVSGASTVPGLTSAVLTKYIDQFQTLDVINSGIATAQKTNRGLATVSAVLGYAGKPFTTLIDGRMQNVYGWQDLCWRKFPDLGWRPLANCDVPDLELFPKYFPALKTVRFRAGLELPILQFWLWALTWFVRIGIVPSLRTAAPTLQRLSRLFDVLGTDNSEFYMEMLGSGSGGQAEQIVFDLCARAGDGLMIPCTPAIILALGLAKGDIDRRGAMPCIGLVKLDDLLREFSSLRITWNVTRSGRIKRADVPRIGAPLKPWMPGTEAGHDGKGMLGRSPLADAGRDLSSPPGLT